jgi:hypothetical protein
MERLRDLLEAYRDDAEDWTRGKSPWWRLVVVLYFVYAGVRHLVSPEYTDWFKGITLVFHEMGHILFIPLGRTMTILGGSLNQLLIPIFAGAHLLLRQRDYFGVAFAKAWLAFSLWDLAVYVGDANREEMPLVSMGPGRPLHDWATLLGEWHLLGQTDLIARCVGIAAFLVWAAALAMSGWLLWKMLRAQREGT